MNQDKRKQAGQVVVLVVLLVVLGASMMFMLKRVTQIGSGARPPATPAAETAGDPAATVAEAVATAEGTETTTVAALASTNLNPNVFKVYDLDPAKNPFVQEERWYSDELSQLPGYPDLRDEDYFDQLNTAIPEFDGLLGEDESWQRISMSKREVNKDYEIVGTNEDGSIRTSLTLVGPPGRTVEVNWTPSMGIPLSALRTPGWESQYLPGAQGVPDSLPSGEDLFQAPGDGVPALNGAVSGSAIGDLLVCQGVSGEGAVASALIIYNDTVRIVQAGDSLPPRYTVDAVTADGVILTDLRRGETKWIPVGGSGAFGGNSVGQVGGAPRPAPTPDAAGTTSD